VACCFAPPYYLAVVSYVVLILFLWSCDRYASCTYHPPSPADQRLLKSAVHNDWQTNLLLGQILRRQVWIQVCIVEHDVHVSIVSRVCFSRSLTRFEETIIVKSWRFRRYYSIRVYADTVGQWMNVVIYNCRRSAI